MSENSLDGELDNRPTGAPHGETGETMVRPSIKGVKDQEQDLMSVHEKQTETATLAHLATKAAVCDQPAAWPAAEQGR